MKELSSALAVATDYGGGEGPGLVFILLMLVVVVVMIAAMWKVYEKAGEPGWAVLIPIYNILVLIRIARKPWWWILLMLIPFVNFVIAILLALAIAKNFGKGAGYAIGIFLLPMIFYPMLAWGDAQYSPVP